MTRGAEGMTVFDEDPAGVDVPIERCEVFDVQGAGDTAITALTLARLAGASLLEAAVIGNAAASVVVREARDGDGHVARDPASPARRRRRASPGGGAPVIASMTGFGRAEFEVAGAGYQVELRSVNQRHLDLQVRLPRALAALRAGPSAPAPGPVRARQDRARGERSARARRRRRSASTPRSPRATSRPRASSRRATASAPTLDVGRLLALPGVARMAEPEVPEPRLRGGARRRRRAGGRRARRHAARRGRGARARPARAGRADRRAGRAGRGARRERPDERRARSSGSARSSSRPRPGSPTRRGSPRSSSGRRTGST